MISSEIILNFEVIIKQTKYICYIKKPIEIITKQLINGQLKYQVKWKGFDETTQEIEENVKKYKELIEDFNYFCLAGERYDNNINLTKNCNKRVAESKPLILRKKIKKQKKVDKTSEIREILSQSLIENGNNSNIQIQQKELYKKDKQVKKRNAQAFLIF